MCIDIVISNHPGNALITVATGVLSDTQADRAGLVPTHAYAVLSVVEYKVSCFLVVGIYAFNSFGEVHEY